MTEKPDFPFEIEFYTEDDDQPVLRWMKEELSTTKRRALGLAMRNYLQTLGTGVCSSQFGSSLGDGLYEFRLRYNLKDLASRIGIPFKPTPGEDDEASILLRVFFHEYDGKVILLLGGYDKGEDPSPKTQNTQIKLARKRLKKWQAERNRQAKQAAREMGSSGKKSRR